MDPIAPKQVRYIKLGAGGQWEKASLDEGTIQFGFFSVPHDICVAREWELVERHFVENESKSPSKARDHTREVRDFYELGEECLWITFARGHLWWTFAEPEVIWQEDESDETGSRCRKTVAAWCNTDIQGVPLHISSLSTKLTQVAAYRQTLCSVREEDYLLRRINDVEEPIVANALVARQAMIDAAVEMIQSLHWADFETMVDLIFARSGWQRVSAVGGTQKDTDLIIEQPTTGERAFVQVKSRATKAVLDDYVERFEADGTYERMFFVCHSPKGDFDAEREGHIHVWTDGKLAEAAVTAGLQDWLIEAVG